jgi:glycosyltransferase involved in cell wall biosynthesis
MDVLAVPSRQDNSPNVIGEALINGTRVLGSKVGGITEILHEFGCPVVDTTNAEVFAKSIIEEMSVKQSRLEISEKAIKIFGYHEIGNKVKKLYEESL